MGRSEPGCHSVLVAGGDGRTPFPDPQMLQDWVAQRPVRSCVVPVLPRGGDSRVLGPALATTTVLFHRGVMVETVPDILRAAGVGGEDRRLFISYRRVDAEALAEQLRRVTLRIRVDDAQWCPMDPSRLEN